MSSRSSGYGVSKLRDRYASDRPLSLDTPRYSSSRTTSSKNVGALQSRFSDKKEATTATPSPGTPDSHGKSLKSDSPKLKAKSALDEKKKKYGTPEKRLSSESGYGSLEREKGRDLLLKLEKAKNDRNGGISKISESGNTGQQLKKDPESEIACTVAKTIAQQNSTEQSDPETKKARMESYKEKRRRELAEKHAGTRGAQRDHTGAPLPHPSVVGERVTPSKGGEEGSPRHGKKNRRSMTEVVKPEETLKDRRDRRVSNLSMETQQLVDTLESTRAARRERLRRSETEDSGQTYRILARHRERQSSLSSTSSEVFPSQDPGDADPTESLVEPEKAQSKDTQPAEKKRSVSLGSQGTGDEDTKESSKSSSRSGSTKQSRDRRRRQNVTITAEDLKEARKIETEKEAKSSSEPSSGAKARKSPFKWEAKVDTPRRPSLENVSTDSEVSRSSPSPRKRITASAAKVETVTVAKPRSSPKLGDDRSKHLAKSSPFEHHKLLPHQGSVSSTDEDSLSAHDSFLRRQKPRSDSAPLIDVFERRKARGLAQTPTPDKSKKSDEASKKLGVTTSQAPKEGESKAKAKAWGDSKTKGSKGKVPSWPFQKDTTPISKSEKKPAEVSSEKAAEQKWTVEEQADWVVIEEEVISKKAVRGENQQRSVSEVGSASGSIVEGSDSFGGKRPEEVGTEIKKSEDESRAKDKAQKREKDKMALEQSVSGEKETDVAQKPVKKSDDGKIRAGKDKSSEPVKCVEERLEGDLLRTPDGVSSEKQGIVLRKEGEKVEKPPEVDLSQDRRGEDKAEVPAGKTTVEKKSDKKTESVIQRKSKPRTLQEKRLRSKTTEIPYGHRESPPASPSTKRVQWRDRQGSFEIPLLPGEDVKRQALKTKDDDLFEVMRLRAQMIKEHEKEEMAEKGEAAVESSSEGESRSESVEPAPREVIKVSVTDRMSAFKQGSSAPLPKALVPKKRILKKPASIDVKPVAAEPTEKQVVSGETDQPVDQAPEDEKKLEETPDQLASLSLSEKMKLFSSLSQQVQKEAAPSPKTRRRFPRKRYDDRSKTQPVTPEELHVIVKNAKEKDEKEENKQGETAEERAEMSDVFRPMEVVTEEPEVEAKEDELTKMSLAEKMKLFHEKARAAPPPPKVQRPKKKRRSGSRYQTQPITLEEMKKASGPSPLVLSFGKGIDPEVAAGLSIGDQMSLMYQAEDVATSKMEPVPSVALPEPAKVTEKAPEGQSDGEVIEKSSKEKLRLALSAPIGSKSPTSIREKPPSPSYPKSGRVDLTIKKARSLDRPDLGEEADQESTAGGREDEKEGDADLKSKAHSTHKEIRAAAEKNRNEMLAEVSSSESEVDSKLISTMDKNSGPGKRRQQLAATEAAERFKTQPATPNQDVAPAGPVVTLRKKVLLRKSKSFDLDRRLSQPVTPEEMAEVRHQIDSSSSNYRKSSSLADRLSSLQQSGENDWRKRVGNKDIPKSPKKSGSESDSDKNSPASSISDRLRLLQSNEDSWRKRVEEKDVSQFTVEGKLKVVSKDPTPTPAAPQPTTPLRRVGSGRKAPNKDLRVSLVEDNESDTTETSCNKVPGILGSDSTSLASTTTESEDSEPDFQVVRKSVAIPKADNETFSKFFQSSTAMLHEGDLGAISEQKTETTLELSVSDFDALTDESAKSNRLTGLNRNDHRRSLRPQRRARPTNNPLRALKTRSNILSEYTEEKMVLAEVVTKPQKKKDLSNKSLAAMSQKVALSEEKEKLQTVKDFREMDGKLSRLLPYKDLMLIQIKGRRMVQVRLIEPKVSSLNSGDCFICVTPTNVFLWIGQYANVIEKSKASEVASHIQSKKDLGCKATSVITIEEAKLKTTGSPRNWKKMVEALGGKVDDVYQEVGANDEDQIHEIYVIDTNMVYRLEGSSLEPYGDYWATLLKYEMLKTDEILVFDFGSELYIWQGKKSTSKQRKKAVQLAYMLYERGYDYSNYDLNPLYPQETDGVRKADQRPDWVLFAKTSEHMETILFQSKFVDWPNESHLIKMKKAEREQKDAMPELVPFDAKLMVQPCKELPNVILEGTNVGRGIGLEEMPCNNNYNPEYFDKVERRGNKITTLSVMAWHVLEYTQSIVPKECFGQFHEGDTYVIRWQYRIEAAGARSLKGHASKWGGGGGRERCAYFFWQGSKSTINEKGASALMTVELDRERGPQRQVLEGKEPAVFLHLFQGRMVVHIGKREEEETNSQGSYRLYYIKGEVEREACLVEVPCKMKMLRSRTSFILLNLEMVDKQKASVHVWHGVKASEVTKKIARFAAEKIKEFVPMETGLHLDCKATIEEMDEGSETDFFFKAVGNDRSSYDSLLGDELKYDYTARLFHLTSSSGVFIANEVMNPSRIKEHITPYPCYQSDLYMVEQPALFVLDNHFEVYLWQGWWPETTKEEVTGKMTGSAQIKWNTERKCAMETVLAYCKEKNPKKPPEAFLIHAGLEPQTFINLFPTWEMRDDVAHINKKAGRRNDRAILVRDVLQQLKRTRYSLAELKEKPEGVDPLKLETYLSDEEFKEVLGVTREAFEKLQIWKKTELKKNAGLF